LVKTVKELKQNTSGCMTTDDWKRCVLRCFLKVFKEVAERTASGRSFHTWAAETTKCSVADGATSYMWHNQLVGGWRSLTMLSAAQCRSLAKYAGTVWLRQWKTSIRPVGIWYALGHPANAGPGAVGRRLVQVVLTDVNSFARSMNSKSTLSAILRVRVPEGSILGLILLCSL